MEKNFFLSIKQIGGYNAYTYTLAVIYKFSFILIEDFDAPIT